MGKTERIAVDLSSETLEVLRLSVERGDYPSTAAAIEAAVRVMSGEGLAHRLERLRQRVQHSLEDGKAPVSADEAERLMRDFMQRSAASLR